MLDFIVWRRVFFAATFTLLFRSSFLGSFRERKMPRLYLALLSLPPRQSMSLATKLSEEVSYDSLSLTTFVRLSLTDVKWLYAKRKVAVA